MTPHQTNPLDHQHLSAVRCGVVPPYLLARLAASDAGHAADVARATLRVERTLRGRREARSAKPPPPERSAGGPSLGPGFVPERLQRHPRLREHRATAPAPAAPPEQARAAAPQRSVHDAEHGTTLPGVLRRGEGAPAHSDESVNEAYDGLGATWTLFWESYARDSLDGAGLPLVASVHFAQDYDNAFWDGQQMVFGDGDGEIFGSFTDSPDVIGHELAHGFTQYTAGFVYVGQSGALNEHISDVFGVLTVQHLLGQDAAAADWLIGKDLFLPGVRGVALRSMKAPGTAYDDPRLGKDPQPAHMDDYATMPHDDAHDNGGVHINSGIPNHAFYRLATALGGHAWDVPGRIWYDAMTVGGLPKDADFAAFAAATLAAATAQHGAGSAPVDAVAQAWRDVGVEPGQSTTHLVRQRAPRAAARAGTPPMEDDLK